MPGLALTLDQARRLWGCDAATCGRVADLLVERRALRWSDDHRLMRVAESKGGAMEIWHDTVDAPRQPRRVSPGDTTDIVVGTWPIGPGQSVSVTWEGVARDGTRRDGVTLAAWHRNDAVNGSLDRDAWSVCRG